MGPALGFSDPQLQVSVITGAVYCQKVLKAHCPAPDSTFIFSHFFKMIFKPPLNLEPALIKSNHKARTDIWHHTAGSQDAWPQGALWSHPTQTPFLERVQQTGGCPLGKDGEILTWL